MFFPEFWETATTLGVVQISDPCFVGEKDYLRAWAYIHSLGAAQSDRFSAAALKDTWRRTSAKGKGTRPKRGFRSVGRLRKRGRDDDPEDVGNADSGTAGGQVGACEAVTSVLEDVPTCDIEILGRLGEGRNGVTLLARWKGQP